VQTWHWVGESPPPEYLEFLLIQRVYHCTPSELDKQDAAIVDLHTGFLLADLEAENNRMNNRVIRKSGKRKNG